MKNWLFGHTLGVLLLALLIAPLGGCALFGYFASIFGEAVPAEYKLADRPTLVMVDDPDNHLDHASRRGQVAQVVGRKLKQEKVLAGKTRLVPPSELRDLEAQLGESYARTPIVQIGRLLDAEQVIHVRVREVDLMRAPGVYEPRMTAEVKVLDAEASRRLFPRAVEMEHQWNSQGRMLSASTPVRTPNTHDSGIRTELMRELAMHTGVRIAQLFYKHQRAEPGATLK